MKGKYKYLSIISVCLLLGSSCTNLNEDVLGGKFVKDQSGGGSASLAGVYDALNGIAGDQGDTFAMQEHTSDELMGPTRGTDWDDFGTWRKLHQHTWDASHNQLLSAWNQLNGGSYKATQVLATSGLSTQQIGEASFLRAYFMFEVMDLFGQVPQREATDSPDSNPKVYSRSDAFDFIIKDLNTAISNLAVGTTATAGVASKQAAQALLAKVMLNKAVYKNDPKSPAGPFTFAAADMNATIAACDAVIASGKYALQAPGSYYKNFYWNNATDSKEIIFRSNNKEKATVQTNVRWFTYMGNHYNQLPSGWNGFTTLSDFYNSFDAKDERKSTTIPGFTSVTGESFGFLVGQQYKGDGTTKILDRSGNPLIFTPNVNLSASTESQGIRTVKYPLDPTNLDNSANDFVWLRYADVLLIKAEAILRGGTATNGDTPASLVSQIRVARGLAAVSSIDLPGLLTERGHEVYLEGWRRNDMVRFGTYNAPVDQRPTASDASRCVFAIPSQAVGSNPNLSQNFGY